MNSRDKKAGHFFVKSFHNLQGLLILSIMLSILGIHLSSYAAETKNTKTIKEKKWQFLGAPYAYANTDVGLVYGVGGGLTHKNGLYALIWGSVSAGGMKELGISSLEYNTENWRFLDVSWASRAPRYIYTLNTNDPEELAVAKIAQYELQLSALRKFGNFEIGPTTLVRFIRTGEAEDSSGAAIPKLTYDRYGSGDVELFGIRALYRTTSVIRPMDGMFLEAAVRAGRCDGDYYAVPRFDMDAELKIGWAIQLNSRNRLYFRSWGIFQLETPPPAQQFLGWERNHRGEPLMREWGRRFLSGRFQYHYKFAHQAKFPLVYLNSLLSFFPSDRLDWEFVPFYDIGAIGDPSHGWNETRHGIGIGIHMIMPPELVFRLDFAYAPGGPVRFFLGAGETI